MKLKQMITEAGFILLVIFNLNARTSKSPTESQSVSVSLDKSSVADLFGNHDGAASSARISPTENGKSLQ